MLPKVEIFCDGACSGNPGPGGYGVILRSSGKEKELSGGALNTTNNRMELTASIVGLKALKKRCSVIVTSDSQYLVKGMNEWLINWKQKRWLNSKKAEVINRDLWEQLAELSTEHEIEWRWIKGHNGHPENERCDELARKEIEKIVIK